MPEFNFPYTNHDLTQEVNRLPNQYGLLNSLGIAPVEPKGSRFVRIELVDGQIYVLSAEPRGAPGDVGGADSEGAIILEIPHFPHIEDIRVDDMDGLLQVINGQVSERSLDRELARKLMLIRAKHALTLEYIRLGMIRGEIKDGKGRVIYNLFDAFDIAKKEVDFKLGTEGTDVRAKVEEVQDHVMTKLQGETTSGVESVVSPQFFNKFISHSKVEKFWLNAQNTSEHAQLNRTMSGGSWGRVFNAFGTLLLREYKGGLPVRNQQGVITTEANVEAGKGHAYPAGTQSMFRTFEAPVYHMDEVNQVPEQDTIYISTKMKDHGEGVEMKSQTNRLAVCKQPETLVELGSSD